MKTKKKRWLRRIVLGVLALVLAGAGVTVYLLQKPPRVWREGQAVLESVTPTAQAEMSERVMVRLWRAAEDGLTGEVLAGRETVRRQAGVNPAVPPQGPADQPLDKTFDIRLTNDELIAVVRDSVGDWTAQRGYELPAEMSDPIAMVQDGRLAIAFEAAIGSWRQVFSGYVDLTFRPDGMAKGAVRSFTAGSLPVSLTEFGGLISDSLPASHSGTAERIAEWVEKLEDFEFRPVLELKDRRRARIVAMRLEDEAVTLTMRVQDHRTYRKHNALMHAGQLAVTDRLPGPSRDGGSLADVPTTTD